MSIAVTVTGALNWESVNRRQYVLAGGGFYAAAAAAQITTTSLIGCVGMDADIKQVRSMLEHCGIESARLQQYPGRTFRWQVNYDSAGSITSQHHDYGDYHHMIPPSTPIDSPVLLLATGHPGLHRSVLSGIQCNHNPLIIADTRLVHIERSLPEVTEVLSTADVVFVNESEFQALAQLWPDAPESIFKQLPGLRLVIKKQRSLGGQVFHRSGCSYSYLGFTTQPIDPTGTGDVFAGTFAGLIASEGFDTDIASILTRCSAAAARSTTMFGTKKFDGWEVTPDDRNS